MNDASRMQAAIERYHALLTDELAGESQVLLDEGLRARGLFFGSRALCTVLRPRFFTPEQHRGIRTRMAPLLSAFRKVHEAALEDDALLAQFGLSAWERDMLGWNVGFRDPSPLSRLDAFYTPETDELWFTEFNGEVPAGPAYGDALAEVFHALPIVREFLREYHVHALPTRPHTLHGLLDAYRQWSGKPARPRIAILDWPDVPTRSEFVLFQEYFAAHGLQSEIVDPMETSYTGGQLVAPGGAVDLIYKRVLTAELVERGGLDHPVFRAVREGAVCMVNPPACKVLHKKASLAVLHDERNARLFSAAQLDAIRTQIPWTRVVEERRTTHGGESVDLLEFMGEHRERLVLKPNDEYGGKGIVLGWTVSPEEWHAAVAHALTEPYIVQERVPLPFEPYPSLVAGRVQLLERMVDTAPYALHGAFVEGYLSRLSTAALGNVTAGGGSQTPTFIVEER